MGDAYDDKTTVLRKSRPSAKDARSNEMVNQAMKTGNVEQLVKRNMHYMLVMRFST